MLALNPHGSVRTAPQIEQSNRESAASKVASSSPQASRVPEADPIEVGLQEGRGLPGNTCREEQGKVDPDDERAASEQIQRQVGDDRVDLDDEAGEAATNSTRTSRAGKMSHTGAKNLTMAKVTTRR